MSKKDNFITVSELNAQIKNLLMTSFNLQLKIKGEISSIKSSGSHTYITLKDENSAINVTAWNAKFANINNGDDVMVSGKIGCYTKQGIYQINASKIERIGIGLLHEELEKNKIEFEKKGYFSKSIKSLPIPNQVHRVGILTASEGAALQDILYVLKSNMFYGEVYIKNCSVQGVMCPESVSNGIKYFDKLNETIRFDALLITRGGGSFEDLVGYSSKDIVKSIYKTNIYTISAVGHEVDNMLSDYAANYRAPTPSIAGEVISIAQRYEYDTLEKCNVVLNNLHLTINNKLKYFDDKIKTSKQILNAKNPSNFVDNEMIKLNKCTLSLYNHILSKYNLLQNKLNTLTIKINSINPTSVMNTGYVAVIDKHGSMISSVDSFENSMLSKQKLKIVFADGEVELNSLIKKINAKKR